MEVAGAMTLNFGFRCLLLGGGTGRRVRGGSIGRQELGLGAIVKTARSVQGRESVVQVPGKSVLRYNGDGKLRPFLLTSISL
jgi:hypothetical protein